MAIRNVELTHKCFHKHACMGIARMKQDREIKEGKKKGVQRAWKKKRGPDGLSIARAYRPVNQLPN